MEPQEEQLSKNSVSQNNFSEKISQNLDQKEQFVICVDPATEIIYTQSLKYNIIKIEDPKNNQQIIKHARLAIQQMKDILNLDEANWLFSKEAQDFRRRKIPSYLLQKDFPQYPRYLAESALPKAFHQQNTKKLKIDLYEFRSKLGLGEDKQSTSQNLDSQQLSDLQQDNYVSEFQKIKEIPQVFQENIITSQPFQQQQQQKQMQNNQSQQINGETGNNNNADVKNKGIIQMEASLISGADDLIKEILFQINKEYKVILEPKQGTRFILQVHGLKEFIYGKNPLLEFEIVRNYLRTNDSLELILIQVESYDKKEQFYPPIIERDLNNLIEDDIVWENYEGVPMILWHPQISLQNVRDQKLEGQERIIYYGNHQESQNIFWKTGIEIEKFDYKQNQFYDENLRTLGTFKPNLPQKIQLQKFQDKFQDQDVMSTGECDTRFKIKIKGIQNILKILDHYFEKKKCDDHSEKPDEKRDETKSATFNGKKTPYYITLNKDIQTQQEIHYDLEDEEQEEGIKNKKKNKEKKQKLPRFVKGNKNMVYDENKNIDKKNQLQNDHGLTHQQFYSNLMKKYKLSVYPYVIYIEIALYHGDKLFSQGSLQQTKKVPFELNPSFNQWIEFQDLRISQLKKEVKVFFDIIIENEKSQKQVIGTTAFQLFSQSGEMNQGNVAINIWPFYQRVPNMACMQQYWGIDHSQKQIFEMANEVSKINQELSENFCQLVIQLPTFQKKIQYSLRENFLMDYLGFTKINQKGNTQKWNTTPSTEDLARLQILLKQDPLSRDLFSEKDKNTLIICRNHYKSLPQGLEIFLSVIDWSDPAQVKEAWRIIYEWNIDKNQEALVLINSNQGDQEVRSFGVQKLSHLYDDQLNLYMLQLVQCLKFEPYHFSLLGEMLLERSLQNQCQIGHEFFWQLYSQLHIKINYERYALLLEQYLFLSGSFRECLQNQVILNAKLKQIGYETQQKNDNIYQKFGKQQIQENINGQMMNIEYPLDLRYQCDQLDSKSCSVKTSKKRPLWLVNKNKYKNGRQIIVMFKCGDDIRQDQFCLQVLKIMDRIWLEAGLDFKIQLYSVKATDDEVGIVEVVQDSETISNIQAYEDKYLGSFKKQAIMTFLKKCSQDNESHLGNLTDNFAMSCAAQTVGSYILGLADRHPSNIMLTQNGSIFHIDFGHFLGNYKTKFGFKRERSPFVFTEQMLEVLGGDKNNNTRFKNFQENCTRAYNLIRQNGNFLINLFIIMVSAGLPELRNEFDISYVKKQLSFEMSESQAKDKFKKALETSLNDTYKKFDDFLHILKNKKGKKGKGADKNQDKNKQQHIEFQEQNNFTDTHNEKS